ncbi:hypothetical protein IV500_05910 [Paeniglutamicibacter antarcticus]|uniref:Uncharacterized protein n=2 Tax=Arthrobacter terrae TaxID=2935737 RepID=A0A931G4M1_9MICC|nr:hypothetical protein [Arthrobacter terrae]
MGHWETEHGEIVLPAAEFAAVRQAVQKVVHEHQTKVFDATQEFWKGLTRKEQTDPEAYTAALRKDVNARHAAMEQAQSSWRHQPSAPHLEELNDDLEWRLTLDRGAKPARVLKTDLPFPTNRTTDFPAGEGSVTFNKDTNTVEWNTGESRNVIDRAHNSAAGAALFDRIKTVKWTRNTGGLIMGNNEYAQEAGHGDACHKAYGPIGAAQEPSNCEEYTDSKGNRVGQAELRKLQQELWEAQRKLQQLMVKVTAAAGRGKTTAASNRGSFAPTYRSEPTIRLGGW